MNADTSLDPSGPIRKLTARGLMLTGASQAFRLLLSIASTVVLARLLAPDDFGLLAMVAPVMAFSVIMQDVGLQHATVQRRVLSPETASTLYWISVVFGFAAAVAMAALAPLTAMFFGRPELSALQCALALAVAIYGFSSQPMAILQRKMLFGRIAIIEIASAAVAFAVAVALAWRFQSYWSLVVSQIAAALTVVILSLALCGWKPRGPKVEREAWSLVAFGSGVSAFSITTFISRNIDNVLIGRFLTASALGAYDRAYRLMLAPIQQVTGPLYKVAVPALSRLVGAPERYARYYLVLVSAILLVAQPGMIALVADASDVVPLLLGEQWSHAAPVFAWLGYSALVQPANATLGWLFISQGRAREYAFVGLATTIVTVAAVGIGLRWGIVGVAMGYVIADLAVRTPLAWTVACRSGPVGLTSAGLLFGSHSVALVCAFGTQTLARTIGEFSLTRLVAEIAASYIGYAAVFAFTPAGRRLSHVCWQACKR